MTFDVDAVQKLLCERFCAEVRLTARLRPPSASYLGR